MATVHATERAPLSLTNYTFRSVIKNNVQNIEKVLIKSLLTEYNILDKMEGSYLVRALEFRMENNFCEQHCVPADKYTWDAMQRVISPDIGDDVRISREGVNFKLSGTFCKTLNLDINWSDSLWTRRSDTINHAGIFHSSPDIYQSIYFEDGQIIVRQWYNWYNDLGIPYAPLITSVWEVGKEQSLTINSEGELIWICTQLHSYNSSWSFPPLLRTRWVCKATRICSCKPGCSCPK